MNKKFLKFKYAAIRRYGEKQWTANADVIEFNPNYTVGVSGCERGDFAVGLDYPYIVELSNGTKFLCFMHNYGKDLTDEILSDKGEVANSYADAECYDKVKKNISKLNSSRYGSY